MIGVAGAARAKRLADVLAGVGLFDRTDGGYLVHDYLEFNATKEEAALRRHETSQARAAAGRIGGLKSGEARKQTGKQTP